MWGDRGAHSDGNGSVVGVRWLGEWGGGAWGDKSDGWHGGKRQQRGQKRVGCDRCDGEGGNSEGRTVIALVWVMGGGTG